MREDRLIINDCWWAWTNDRRLHV